MLAFLLPASHPGIMVAWFFLEAVTIPTDPLPRLIRIVRTMTHH
ncbi:MAG TPA: hypothetical protein PLV96_04475 [Methanoregulaceae archaeon]|nr:hypothetical protein [Methanoregulaceae archaeon]